MITFVQVVLIIGALCGGAFAFDLLEKGNNAGGIGSDVLAVARLALVVTLELKVKR